MTTANKITLLRVALIPVFLVLCYLDFPYHEAVAFIVFALAALSDGIDGHIARKYNQITTFGKFVDPLADKLLVISALLVFVQNGYMHSAAAFIIIARELIITSLRIIAMGEGVVMAAGISGKIKTFTQMTIILIMLVLPTVTELFAPEFDFALSMNILSWIMAAVTLWSGIDYMWRHRKLYMSNM